MFAIGAIDAMTPAERRAARRQYWQALEGLEGQTFNPRAGLAVTLVQVANSFNGQPAVALWLRVVRDGEVVLRATDEPTNPFVWTAPPLMIPQTIGVLLRNALVALGPNASEAQYDAALTARGVDPSDKVLRWAAPDPALWRFAPLLALRADVADVLRQKGIV